MSKSPLFGKDTLLAIASELSEDSNLLANFQSVEKIARAAKLRFIEICAQSLFQTTTLTAQIPAEARCDALSAAFWLMSVYEHLTGFNLSFENSQWIIKSATDSKRKHGQYFTPRNLTELATRSALQKLMVVRFGSSQKPPPVREILALRIVDPAMGAGAFLVSALNFLAGQVEDSALCEIAENCLYGVDLDPLAADITTLVISVFCSIKLGRQELVALPGLKEHLKSGNALLGLWKEKSDVVSKADLDRICLSAFGDLDWSKSKFFHWQFEFAEVFANGGFDAVLSNPPWEMLKPNATEFFATYDNNYRAIGIVEREIQQRQLLQKSAGLESRWLSEQDFYAGFSRFLKLSATRADDSKTRYGINRPFRSQGGADLNCYKLFVELSYCLLAKNGCMSLIIPSGIYTDHGTRALRDLLLADADIFEINSFLNRDQTFSIHPSFNFCVFSVCNQKSGGNIAVSFGNVNATAVQSEKLKIFEYSLADLHSFSPKFRSLLEVSDARDLSVLRKIYAASLPLHQITFDDSSAIAFKREFDLTNDSASFVSRDAALTLGYVADQYGNFLRGNWQPADDLTDLSEDTIYSHGRKSFLKLDEVDDVLLPLYEGRMLGQFDCRRKVHLHGSGRTAVWQTNAETDTLIQSQYLMHLDRAGERSNLNSVKIGYQAVGSSTNARTMIAAALSGVPCGNSVPVLSAGQNPWHNLALLSCLNSFVFDFVLRSKMTGNNINFYLLQDCPLPDLKTLSTDRNLLLLTVCLSFSQRRFARELLMAFEYFESDRLAIFLGIDRRILQAALDACVARAYGLSVEDYSWILRCADTDLKGFWRVDKTLQSADRQTTLALEYFQKLLELGDQEFFANLASNSSHFPVAKGSTLEKRKELQKDADILRALFSREKQPSQPSLQTGR